MSFRNRSTFLGLVKNSLTSNLWNTIKDSLLGSELIAYAAEFLYQNELLSNGVVQSVYPASDSSILNLLLCGNFNNVAFSYFRPATLTVRIDTSDTRNSALSDVVMLEPYTIRLSKGNIVYTNIDWVTLDKDITLYQGTATMLRVNNSATPIRTRFPQVSPDSNEPSVYRSSGTSDFYSYYINLESLPYAESVYVYSYKVGSGWKTYQLYDPISANRTSPIFKLLWSNDLKLQLHFGNGIWGDTFKTDESYCVYFLNATFNTVETNGLVLEVYGRGNSFAYDVIDYQNYSVSVDTSYANLTNALSKSSVISTKSQVETFVKSHPLVKDCAVVQGSNVGNTVHIYVRPNVENEDNFDTNDLTDVTEALQTYGDIVTRYVIERAKSKSISILVTLLDFITGESAGVLDEVKEFVYNQFDTSEMSIGESVNFSELSNDIYKKFGYRNIVRYYVKKEIVSDGQLTFLPVLSTLQSLDTNIDTASNPVSSWRGTIENGILWEKIPFGINDIDYAFQLGDFLLVSGTFSEGATPVSVKTYIMSGNVCKELMTDSDIFFMNGLLPDSTTSTTVTQRLSFTYVNETEGFANIGVFFCGDSRHVYNRYTSLRNYGYFSNSSNSNVFSPNVGVIDINTNSWKPATTYSANSIPIVYGGRLYHLNSDGSLSNDATPTDTISLYGYNGGFLGFYVTDSDIFVLTTYPNSSYGVNHSPKLSNVRLLSLSVSTEESVPVSLTDMIVGIFSGVSFGDGYGSFITSVGQTNLQNDGRLGVNIIGMESMDTSKDIYFDNGYALLEFIPGAYTGSATTYKYYLSDSQPTGSTLPAGATLLKTTQSTSGSDAVSNDIYTFAYLTSFTNTKYLIKTLASNDTVVSCCTLSPQASNTSLSINITTVPTIDGITLNSNVVGSYTFVPTDSGLTPYNSLSLSELHYLCKSRREDVEETSDTTVADLYDFYLYAEFLNWTDGSVGDEVSRFILRCRKSGNSLTATYVDQIDLLTKVGAFNSQGKLTSFDTIIENLVVTYEAQNSYFEVDETSYISMNEEDINVKSLQ